MKFCKFEWRSGLESSLGERRSLSERREKKLQAGNSSKEKFKDLEDVRAEDREEHFEELELDEPIRIEEKMLE